MIFIERILIHSPGGIGAGFGEERAMEKKYPIAKLRDCVGKNDEYESCAIR